MGEDPNAIRDEIAETRERMGETIDALGYKADVKSRAKEAAAANARTLRRRAAEAGRNPAVRRAVPPALAALALVAGVVLVVRGRRPS